jgi:hypothetical protein
LTSAPLPGFLEVARRPAVVRRALRYAVVVGTILVSINHGDAILRGDVSTGRLLRIVLTCMVPYCVSTASSVEATRAFARERGGH